MKTLAAAIRDAARKGLVLTAEADSVGLTLHFEAIFQRAEWDRKITWEEIESTNNPSLLADAVNHAHAMTKIGLDPTGAPHYTFARGGVVQNDLALPPRETVIPFATLKQSRMSFDPRSRT